MSSAASTHRPAPLAELPPIFGALHDAKVKSGLTFEQIAHKIERSEWWTAGLFYGQAKPEQRDIKALARVLDIYLVDALGPSFFPTRGVGEWPPKGDPVIYRLYEVLLVYGHSIKHIIHEKLGDGIMSAIDFTGAVERVEQEDGSTRVKITFDGKFLPYKRW